MQSLNDTIVALSTPPGTGAIGVIRLSGASAISIAEKVFSGKKLSEQPSHTLHHGFIKNGDEVIDEVVIGIFKAPHSYTTEDVIEISCHGSDFIIQKIISLLIEKGARTAKPGEFTMRAFLNGRMDLAQAEAVADLIAAQTQASHDMALNQMRGGYSSELKNLRFELIHFASLLELELDFSEEDVQFAERSHLLKLLEKINSELDKLIRSFELGNVIKNGVTTVIAGRPNAGKSTLLNALLNEERAIVSEIPGTTRDTIEENLNINGILFRLIDTAGIREAHDVIEKIGVERTMEKISSSTLLLYVFDVSEMTIPEVKDDLSRFSRDASKLIMVVNKIDKGLPAEKVLPLEAFPSVAFVSSLNRENIDSLRRMMFEKIAGEQTNLESAVVTNARHVEALKKTKAILNEVTDSIHQKESGELTALHLRRALQHLGEITGEVTTDDLLENIFSKFCIGK
ncbi:MAG: tRNA uridine-5-carboxymethylaminomethyl(34) synthesis GTPase MnmE [Chitinophagales bacterium]|nr:tRNA uridine-5-carboxymethylaminomethyl(34) synthesis GTPase MnmE [Chitinophagales bacterium]